MKWLCVIVLVLGFYLPTSWAKTCQFDWEAPTTNEDGSPLTDLVGYRLYRSETPGDQLLVGNAPIAETDAATTTVTIQDCVGEHYYIVTAIDVAENESAPSNEVFVDALAPSEPGGLKATITITITIP